MPCRALHPSIGQPAALAADLEEPRARARVEDEVAEIQRLQPVVQVDGGLHVADRLARHAGDSDRWGVRWNAWGRGAVANAFLDAGCKVGLVGVGYMVTTVVARVGGAKPR